MSGTNFSGPVNSLGPAIGNSAGGTPAQDYSPEFGPSAMFNGVYLPDFRQAPFNKDNPQIGSFPGNYLTADVIATDATPSASNQSLTSGGNATQNVPLVNITAGAAGLSLAIPFFPFGSSTLTTGPICLDFGWGTINISSSVTPTVGTPATGTIWRYFVGQWVVIDTCGNSGGTIPLIAQVVAVGTSTVTLSSPALFTNTAAAVGSGNQFNYLAYGNPAAVAHSPRVAGGLSALLDPTQCLARGVGITGVSGGTGGAFTVKGYDMYLQPQSEVITVAAGANTVYGNKTYKFFTSATPTFASDAHAYTVVTSDLFGYAIRSDEWEQTLNFYNGTLITTGAVTTTSGWVAGDQTSPATTATKDVRGTLQISARGPSATPTGTTYPNGSRRLMMLQRVWPTNAAQATLANPSSLYGVTPV